jgi:hypothetical protein
MADASQPREPFLRTVGKRRPAAAGTPPSAEARAAMADMAQYRTCVPKGVFIYASHEAANLDWERWRTQGMVANTRVKPHA